MAKYDKRTNKTAQILASINHQTIQISVGDYQWLANDEPTMEQWQRNEFSAINQRILDGKIQVI